MQKRKHNAGRDACSHRQENDRGKGRNNQRELAEARGKS